MQIVPHFWFNTNVFTIIFVPDLTSCKLGLPFTSLGSSCHEKTPHCWLKFVYQHLSCNGNIFAIIAWKLATQCLSVALSVDMWVLYMYLPTTSTDLCTLFTGSNYCFLKASLCMFVCHCVHALKYLLVLTAPVLCSSRYGLALLSCYGFFVAYALRVNLSVAMVDMLRNSSSSTNVSGSVCPRHASPARPRHNHTVRTVQFTKTPELSIFCEAH